LLLVRQALQEAGDIFRDAIDDGLGFSLVPWRPVIEKEIAGRSSASCVERTFPATRPETWAWDLKFGIGTYLDIGVLKSEP